MKKFSRPLEVLLVEDNPGDVRLVGEALKGCGAASRLSVVRDGMDALAFLRRTGRHEHAPRPDLIFLDLKIPKKSGLEVLAAVKTDPVLRRIPVAVLTSSDAEQDIRAAYDLSANCYVTKRLDLQDYFTTVQFVAKFWFSVAHLPIED